MSFDIYAQSITFWILSTIVVVTFFVQLYYYLFVFRRAGLKKHRNISLEYNKEPVSVVICVKNEVDNLKEFLPLILEQDYPEYEIIIVNDNSEDDSVDLLEFTKTKYSYLHVRNLVANNTHGKSLVLGVGIKAAKYDNIILTDSNCRPSTNWINALAAGFVNSKVQIGYTRHTGNKFIQTANYFDALFLLGAKRPATGLVENSGFKKDLFFDNNGFNSLIRKQDKVEQIFLNSVIDETNYSKNIHPFAITESVLSVPFKDWYRDLLREIYSKRLFKKGTRWGKLPEIISRGTFYGALVAAMLLSKEISFLCILAGIFMLRLLTQVLIFRYTQKAFGERKILFRAIVWDLWSWILYLVAHMSFRSKNSLKYSN